jgi:hypothetical protein
MQFSLWDAASGGSQLGGTLTVAPVGVTNGLFTVTLDFGTRVFTGPPRWLEIAVRTNLLSFTTLSPRQPLAATPYAILAGNISGVIADSSLPASPSFSGTVSSGGFSGSGTGLTALNASQLASGTVPDARLSENVARTNQVWLLGGNEGTSPGTHFLGTTDNQSLELLVNNQRALRLEPNTDNAPNVIGGYAGNYVSNTVVGATIGGGGAGNWFGTAYTNRVLGSFGTVGGGVGNTASDWYATLGGGYNNIASGFIATVGGGFANIASAGGATVPGGRDNRAGGIYSFAAGHRAKANHTGTFVWADVQDANFESTDPGQFPIRASGGVGINNTAPVAPLTVAGNGPFNSRGAAADRPRMLRSRNRRTFAVKQPNLTAP